MGLLGKIKRKVKEMGLTLEEALAATNPADSAEKRHQSALTLMVGAAASDIYWTSRGEIERLFAIAGGYQEVKRGDDSPAIVTSAAPPEVGTGADGIAADVTDAEVVEPEPEPQSPPSPVPASVPHVDPAVARLREQLRAAGIAPEA